LALYSISVRLILICQLRKYSNPWLELIDACLELDPLQRPQSVYTLQKALMQTDYHTTPRPGLLQSLRQTLARLGGKDPNP
jgi:hypothetical protein